MYVYFVGEENEAYYRSVAFGRMLAWFQLDPKRTKLRDVKGKRSFLIEDVPTVTEALSILETIRTLQPV